MPKSLHGRYPVLLIALRTVSLIVLGLVFLQERGEFSAAADREAESQDVLSDVGRDSPATPSATPKRYSRRVFSASAHRASSSSMMPAAFSWTGSGEKPSSSSSMLFAKNGMFTASGIGIMRTTGTSCFST